MTDSLAEENNKFTKDCTQELQIITYTSQQHARLPEATMRQQTRGSERSCTLVWNNS
ncbi:hypothetical protein KXX03_009447 [Aspergillus fumigatus]|nr:hypothetical protein KXX03_009447 [Aspergillus fumigatus]